MTAVRLFWLAALALLLWLGVYLLQGRGERDNVVPAAAPLLPGLSQRLPNVAALKIVGAGNQVLVSLRKQGERWTVDQRDAWPADVEVLRPLLTKLAQARRVEAKTNDPARYPRLAVEDAAGAEAKGTAVVLEGGGAPITVIVGHNAPSGTGSFVRLANERQAWLADTDLAVERDPLRWLDRRIADVPLARIDRVLITPTAGPAYTLVRVDDRFSLEGMPASALGEPASGDALAGFLDQLTFDDVAADAPDRRAEQTLQFIGLDGVSLTVEAWREQDKVWTRVRVALDQARATVWASGGKPADAASKLAGLQAQVAEWQARFAGHRFRLPAYKAQYLLRSRDHFLVGHL